jgi:photosystem II stability/assembly factor-like uncharacterized protein
MQYKLKNSYYTGEPCAVIRTDDNGQIWGIPFDPANTDAVEFCKWLKDGNIPEAADGGEVPTQAEIDAIIAKLS